MVSPSEAPRDCSLCPRLADFLAKQRSVEPAWHNAPVRSFGPETARLLVVGLAPGLRGANRTGRPFTGDFAGALLYETLAKHGFSRGAFQARTDDGLELVDCMVTNAVRCVPPENKPTPAEINTCRQYLASRIAALPNMRAIVCLGRISHDSTLRALRLKLKDYPFAHGRVHTLASGISLYDSYHCSRYNTNTGVLTPDMFHSVFATVRTDLEAGERAPLLHRNPA